MNENKKIGRRQVIGGLGAGLAVMAASPVFASEKNHKRNSLFHLHWKILL